MSDELQEERQEEQYEKVYGQYLECYICKKTLDISITEHKCEIRSDTYIIIKSELMSVSD